MSANELRPGGDLLWSIDVVPAAVLPPGEVIPEFASLPKIRQRCSNESDDLVSVTGDGLAIVDAYAALGILPDRPTLLRSPLLQRLRDAASALPQGFGLVVLDAHRTLDEQQALIDHYEPLGAIEGYVAAVDPDGMRPPHTTGGAVDVTLSWLGKPLALGTDFDAFTDAAHLSAFEPEDGVVRRLRRLLASVMIGAGFVPYPPEWWHWSHGDDVWAASSGVDALYDVIDR